MRGYRVWLALFLAIASAARAQTFKVLPLPANDLVYDAGTASLYVTVPGSAGPHGNSLCRIDPVTGKILSHVWIGSEPNKIAPSRDGQYLYIGLDGAGAVRRFNLTTQAPELQFSLGNDPQAGPYRAHDMAVLPGAPHSVAVSLAAWFNGWQGNAVAIFDDGAPRQSQLQAQFPYQTFDIGFAADPSTLYVCANSDCQTLAVDGNGVTQGAHIGQLWGPLRYDATGGRFYAFTGAILDPAIPRLAGTLQTADSAASVLTVCPDIPNGRLFAVVTPDPYAYPASHVGIVSYDARTLLPTGYCLAPGITVQNIFQATSLCLCGPDRLAFRTPTSVVILHGLRLPGLAGLILTAETVHGGGAVHAQVTLTRPAPAGGAQITISGNYRGYFSAPATVTVPAGSVSTTFRIAASVPASTIAAQVAISYGAQGLSTPLTIFDSVSSPAYPANAQVSSLTATDLVFRPQDGQLYATVSDLDPLYGNSVVRIDPRTGAVRERMLAGSQPHKLALSSDGRYLYVSLDGSFTVRRYDFTTQQWDIEFGLGDNGFFGLYSPASMVTLPGSPDALAVTRAIGPNSDAVLVYDAGVPRPSAADTYGLLLALAAGADSSRLYAADTEGNGVYVRYSVDASGVKPLDTTLGLSEPKEIRFDAGRVYGSDGVVIDAETRKVLGKLETGTTYPYPISVLPDSADGKVFLYATDLMGSTALYTFSTGTLKLLEPFPLQNIDGAWSLTRIAHDRIAFLSYGKLVLLDTTISRLAGFRLDATTVTGGAAVGGRVRVTNVAPVGGATVALSSDNPAVVSVPSVVAVSAGTLSAVMNVSTASVTTPTTVTLSATYRGVTRRVKLTVTP